VRDWGVFEGGEGGQKAEELEMPTHPLQCPEHGTVISGYRGEPQGSERRHTRCSTSGKALGMSEAKATLHSLHHAGLAHELLRVPVISDVTWALLMQV
jgi:hypothetical protein